MATRVYRTGKIARLCGVAPRTVSKWIDSGRLKGYRVPGSKDRRVTHDELMRFAAASGMNHVLRDMQEPDRDSLLIVGVNDSLATELGAKLTDYRVVRAANTFAAGSVIGDVRPCCVIVDGSIGSNEVWQVVMAIRNDPKMPHTVTVAVLGPDQGLADLIREWSDGVFVKPLQIDLFIETVKRLIAERKRRPAA
jgi:excisionase family DNA binding protein